MTSDAIISLTSWKMRINTCSTTISNLLKVCPGFHIVLVLAEEEFPKKEKELPANLMKFVKDKLVEILWVKKNYKAFKKWVFTSQKYPDKPIITADDDCVYLYNYAKELYGVWLQYKNCIITYIAGLPHETFAIRGCATLYPPGMYKRFLPYITDEVVNLEFDDMVYAHIVEKLQLPFIRLRKDIRFYVRSHTKVMPLSDKYKSNRLFSTYDKIAKL